MENIIECQDPISRGWQDSVEGLRPLWHCCLVMNNLHRQLQLKVKAIKQEKSMFQKSEIVFDSS